MSLSTHCNIMRTACAGVWDGNRQNIVDTSAAARQSDDVGPALGPDARMHDPACEVRWYIHRKTHVTNLFDAGGRYLGCRRGEADGWRPGCTRRVLSDRVVEISRVFNACASIRTSCWRFMQRRGCPQARASAIDSCANVSVGYELQKDVHSVTTAASGPAAYEASLAPSPAGA